MLIEITDNLSERDSKIIAEILGVTKYEKPIPAQLAGQAKGTFPTHLVSKTDEDNLKSNIKVLEELREADYVEATLKIDGTSATYIKEADGTFRVCSRNMELKDTEGNVYWDMARKYNIQENLKAGYAIQGEIAGPGIQGNPDGSSVISLCLFNVFDLSTRKPLNRNDWDSVCPDMKKVLVNRTWTKEEFSNMDIDGLQNYVNQHKYSSNQSYIEGLVFRGIKDGQLMYSKKLQKMLSVKIINQNYKD